MRWKMFLPVVMLICAALACDAPQYDPLMVRRVEADANTPGRAYTLVRNQDEEFAYETDDYGVHWRRSELVFSDEENDSYSLTMRDETVYWNDRPLWSFPQPTFRQFFLDDSYGQYFKLSDYGAQLSNSIQGDVIYVEMGTEGVLVGPAPDKPPTRDWELTANGIDKLKPLPLVITDPLRLLGIALLALLVPPLPLIHAYVLSRVWVYLMPLRQAWGYALQTSLGLSLIAAAFIVYWLTSVRTDFYPIVGVMTVVTVMTGVGVTLSLAQRQDVPQTTTKRLCGAAVLVSLLVPIGVAGIFATWWAVFLLISGYIIFQRVYFRHFVRILGKPKDELDHWMIDRLTLETLLIATIITIVAVSVVWLMKINAYTGASLLPVVVFGGSALLGATVLEFHARKRFAVIIGKNLAPSSVESVGGATVRAVTALIGWAILVATISIGTFFGQMYAYGWFTTLLTTAANRYY